MEKLGGWPLTLLVAEGEQAGLRLSSRRAGRLSSPPGVTYYHVITEPQASTKRPEKSYTKVINGLDQREVLPFLIDRKRLLSPEEKKKKKKPTTSF